jgi:hypothetical protein
MCRLRLPNSSHLHCWLRRIGPSKVAGKGRGEIASSEYKIEKTVGKVRVSKRNNNDQIGKNEEGILLEIYLCPMSAALLNEFAAIHC